MCTTQTAYNARSMFLGNLPERTLIFAFGQLFYLLCFLPLGKVVVGELISIFFNSLGSLGHEQCLFVHRKSGANFKHKANPHEILFYDSDEGVNITSIGERFMEMFKLRSFKQCYPTAPHGRINDDQHCGNLNWLKKFCNFYYGVNPFDRQN